MIRPIEINHHWEIVDETAWLATGEPRRYWTGSHWSDDSGDAREYDKAANAREVAHGLISER